MRIAASLPLAFTFLFVYSNCTYAAEHPGEHPGMAAHEHPGEGAATAEHPGKAATASAKEIREAIQNHVEEVSKMNDGYYPIRDDQENKDLLLEFEKVHDRVSHIKKEDACFACADFKTADGAASYDVDFWMKQDAEGKLAVYKSTIHKKDGKARFTYKDDEIAPVE